MSLTFDLCKTCQAHISSTSLDINARFDVCIVGRRGVAPLFWTFVILTSILVTNFCFYSTRNVVDYSAKFAFVVFSVSLEFQS